MNKQELKFYIREEWYKLLRTLKYFMLEPYFICKRLIYDKYTPMLIFWITLLMFIIMWQKGIFQGNYKIMKSMGIMVFLAFFYMFHKSGKAEEYYKKEYIEGKEIK